MNILINGTGASGIALGASMISQGANISFYSRKETACAIKNSGVKRVGLFNHLSYSPDNFNVYTDYEDLPKNSFDFVFICSKTTANDDISTSLNEYKQILKENAKIILFQNGYGNTKPFLRYFDKDQIYSARVITGFKRLKRNISEITVYTEPILIGSLFNSNLESIKSITEMITKSGIPSEISEDIDKYIWAKMIYNCTLNPLGAILKVNYGKLTENSYSKEIMNSLIEEIFEVITIAGYNTLWKNAEEYKQVFYSKLVPDTYYHKSSTYQDIQKKQKTEIDFLNGIIIDLGKKYNIKTPVNQVIYNMIKSIESDF